MKKTGLFAASIAAAASATALSAPPSTATVPNTTISDQENRVGEISPARRSVAAAVQFAPRFDGLRFIETLVTAHR